MVTSLRPLGLLKEVIQQLGLDVIDEYEDLVFVSRNQFILKFTGQDGCIDLYFNEDIEEERAQALMALMEGVSEGKGLHVVYKGAFCLTPGEDNQIELEFFDLSDA